MAADPTASPAPSTTRRQIAHQADGPLAGNGKALHLPVHLLGKLATTSTRPTVMAGETLALPLIALALGLLWAPEDPLQARGAFPWPWLAPVVLALRYGPMAGLGGACVLLAGWLALNLGHFDAFPQMYFLGGLILVLLVGEFSSLWHARTRRAETLQLYLDQRLEHLVRQHYLLRLLAQYCQLESAAVYPVANDQPVPQALASIGTATALQADDPLVLQALQTRKLCHISQTLAAQRESRYLVVAPLLDLAGELYGLLVVEELPFFALQAENLQTIHLLLGYYTDGLSVQTLARPIVQEFPGCPALFAFEVQRLAHIHASTGVPSILVALEFHARAVSQGIPQQIQRLKRELDEIWRIEAPQREVLAVLMPLGDAATAEGYIARLESWMHQKNDQSLAEAGVFAHVVALDSNAPIETVRHIHGIAHA